MKKLTTVVIDRLTRKKNHWGRRSDIINHFDLTLIKYFTQNTFFQVHTEYSRQTTGWAMKSLKKYQKFKILQSIFSYHNKIKLEIIRHSNISIYKFNNISKESVYQRRKYKEN